MIDERAVLVAEVAELRARYGPGGIMVDKITARSPMAEMEARVGLEPIEKLLHERAVLVAEVAELRARYGPGGTFDPLRKAELSTIAALLRAQGLHDKVKLTEAAINEAAHADDRYIGFITQATKDRTRHVILEDLIDGIEQRIRRGHALAYFAGNETRL